MKKQIDRTKPTTRRKFLVTIWTHPDAGQSLCQPGNKRQTRQTAIETFFGTMDFCSSPRKLKGVEEYWSNEEINSCGEYQG